MTESLPIKNPKIFTNEDGLYSWLIWGFGVEIDIRIRGSFFERKIWTESFNDGIF